MSRESNAFDGFEYHRQGCCASSNEGPCEYHRGYGDAIVAIQHHAQDRDVVIRPNGDLATLSQVAEVPKPPSQKFEPTYVLRAPEGQP